MVTNYTMLCPVVFGAGALGELGNKVKELGGKKVFCIYDAGVKNAGLAEKMTKVLDENQIDFLFGSTRSMPAGWESKYEYTQVGAEKLQLFAHESSQESQEQIL